MSNCPGDDTVAGTCCCNGYSITSHRQIATCYIQCPDIDVCASGDGVCCSTLIKSQCAECRNTGAADCSIISAG